MGVHGWKRIIAITVLIAFIGTGLAWATDQSSPQFQEQEAKPGQKSHKKFPIWTIPVAIAVGVGIYLLTQKKNNPIPPGPTPQKYTVKIYSTMKSDAQRTITFDSLPNASKSFSSTDLSIAGVYDKYIVMRSEGSNNELGQWLGFGKDKSVSFTTPANTTLCAYFFENMDNGRNDLYDKMIENENQTVEIPPGRNSSWYRFDTDGQSGPQSVWDHAATQLNNALSYAFKVGSISATGGTKHKYGYRFCEGADGSKRFDEFWIGVNSDKLGLNYVIGLERTALEEWFEYVTYSNNIDDKP